MIKSLLGEDENTEKKDKETSQKVKGDEDKSAKNSSSITEQFTTQDEVKTENIVVDTKEDEIETIDEIKTAIETGKISEKETPKTLLNESQIVEPFEVEKPIGQPIVDAKNKEVENNNSPTSQVISNPSRASELEKKLREIEEELKKEKELELKRLKVDVDEKVQLTQQKIQQVKPIDSIDDETLIRPKQEQPTFLNDWDKADAKQAEEDKSITITQKDFVPDTNAEGVRKMGMAWSAAIAFFGSVVFMLVLGWGADLLLGSEPWGIVVGILIGAAIGFVQLIRTTSQIFKPKLNDFDKVSLRSNIETIETKVVEANTENIEENLEVKNENKTVEVAEIKELETPVQEIIEDIEKIEEKVETVTKIDS